MKEKTFFLVPQVLSFRHAKQTSKNVADTTFNVLNAGARRTFFQVLVDHINKVSLAKGGCSPVIVFFSDVFTSAKYSLDVALETRKSLQSGSLKVFEFRNRYQKGIHVIFLRFL